MGHRRLPPSRRRPPGASTRPPRHRKRLIDSPTVLAVLFVGAALLSWPTRGRVLAVRVVALAAVAASVFGLYEHVRANHRAAPLDDRYATTWAGMSFAAMWWAAASRSVGPAPPIAAAVPAQAAICLAFATAGHPALRPSPAAKEAP